MSHWRVGLLAIMATLAVTWSANAAPTNFGVFPNNSTHSNASVAAAISNVPTNAGVVYDAIGGTNSIQVFNFGSLSYTGPIDVSLTLERIRNGGWISEETDDGGFFNFNNPGELPNIPRKGNNYYMEFVVWPSITITATNETYDPSIKAFGTVAFPGPMRLLIGLGGEVYFTGDHYGDGAQTNAYFVNPVPSPDTFQITSVTMETNGVSLTWPTVGGRTNVVQATDGSEGAYSNNFVDISPIIIGKGGDLTNASYLDVDGATNFPSRYYRVRLVP